ncbi:hypothetical protein C4587_01000 [Candidatus Parcubacteria bacterium]|nr:MAG: hypothetical protein C4587_01000 [Candidatus Parcubacteria bacterium]
MAFGWNDVSQILGGASDALGAYRQQRTLADLGRSLETGDYKGAARAALAGGDLGTGVSLLRLGEDAEARRLQREADANAFGLIGGGISPLGAAPAQAPANIAANDEVSRYIAEAAAKRGIDPNVALRVYASEGRSGYAGDNGSSFGPFQLHYGGVAPGGNRVAGLGDEFTRRTGLDARDPNTWRQQVDFALEQAAKSGWGPWHGAAKIGIGQREGIGGQPVRVADASGAIPASASAGDPLETRIQNITRALSNPNISPNARQILSVQLQEAERRRSEARQEADRAENRAFRRQQIDLEERKFAGQANPYERKLAEERAKNVAEMEQTRAQAARAAEMMLPHIDRAEQAYNTLSRLKAIGPISASTPSRLVGGVLGSDAEAARQDYEAAAKELELAKAQITMKGQGQITESERKILGLTLPRLDAAKPETGLKTLKIWRELANKAVGENASREPSAPSERGPSVGTIEDGYRFKGGDPANPASWEKVQ